MMRKHYFFALLCGLASLVLAGCVEELPEERRALSGRGIGFSTSVVNGWDEPSETRASRSASVGDPVQMEGGRQTLYLHAEVVDGISLHKFPAMDQASSTRGVMREASNLYDSFGVLGYSFTGSWDGSQTPVLMYNVEASKGSSVYETGVYWPGSDENVRFYAYAPYSEADGVEGLSVSDASLAGAPKLTYEVPADVTKQSDLLATLCDETATQDHTSPQSLEFHHLLTAVCFKIGDGMAAGTINKITLKNIKYKGTYAFPAAAPWTSDKGSWAVDDDVKDFSCSPNFTTDGTANVQVNTGEDVFMMLPQTLGDDAVVEVEFTDASSNTDTYSATIKGLSAWEQGKTVTYAISLDPNAAKYFLTVVPTDATAIQNMSYWGDAQTVDVVSYKEADGTQEAVKWTITGYSLDGGNTWIASTSDDTATFSPATGDGGTAANSTSVQLNFAPYEIGTPQNVALTDATAVSDYDLSLHDVEGTATSRTTANCYVVRAPGTYKFPCVYGNALKNGSTNEDAYKATVTQAELEAAETTYNQNRQWYQKATLLNFINAYGEPITDPWIDQNQHEGSNISMTAAEIVWQDSPNLVQNVGLMKEGGHSYVTFTVTKEDIAVGNALIQVKSSDGIVQWSWHIWFTPLHFTEYLTTPGYTGNTKNLTYSFPYVASPFATGNEEGYKCNTFQKANPYAGFTQGTIDNGVMLVPLGLIHEPVGITFHTQELLVKVVQDESGKEATFVVKQLGGSDTDFYVRSTHYQWGRKDPFPTQDALDGFTYQIANEKSEKPKLYEGIQHPNTLYVYTNTSSSDDGWWNGNALDIEATEALKGWSSTDLNKLSNLWDVKFSYKQIRDNAWWHDFSQVHSVKSVYDPCPPGFKVPEMYAMQAFQADDVVDIINNYGSICNFSSDKRVVLVATGTRGGFYNASSSNNGHFVNIELTSIYWGVYWSSSAFQQQGDGAVSLYFNTYRSSPWFRSAVMKGDSPSNANFTGVPQGCAIFLCKDEN